VQSINSEALAHLAEDLDVDPTILKVLEVGWADEATLRKIGAGGSWKGNLPWAYSCPERDEKGRIVGIALRSPSGEKGAGSKNKGSRRGLTYSKKWIAESDGLVFVVEGMTDVAAGMSAGFATVGRPSNTSGADYLALLLKEREVIVLGENDQKENGTWPGRDGAIAVAQKLADKWGFSVQIAFPPIDAKDLRECWKRDGLLEAIKSTAELIHPSLAGQAESEILLGIVLEKWTPAQNQLGETILVPKEGGGVARAITFSGLSSANTEFYHRYEKVSKKRSLGDVVNLLTSMAIEGDLVETHSRTASVDNELIYDLGNDEQSFVHVYPNGVQIREETQLYFMRSNSKRQSLPTLPGDLSLLEEYLTVNGDGFHAIIVWILTAWVPGVPTPVLILKATEGSGKSVQAALLAMLVDPSASQGRSLPRDEERWQNTVHGSKLLFLDNISTIPNWLSDLMCMAVTGHSFQKRKLYTDGDIFEREIQIAIIMTTIELGRLRPDLADRSFILHLPRLDDKQHVAETKIREAFARDLPAIFGGLFTALSMIQAVLPSIRWDGLSRMADFERNLMAYDAVFHTNAHTYYRNQRNSISDEIVEDDPFASWLVSLLTEKGKFQGIASELFKQLPRNKHGDLLDGFPRNSRAVSAALNRLDRILERKGIRQRRDGKVITLLSEDPANSSQKEGSNLVETPCNSLLITPQNESFAKSATQETGKSTGGEQVGQKKLERGNCESSDLADGMAEEPGNNFDWGTST